MLPIVFDMELVIMLAVLVVGVGGGIVGVGVVGASHPPQVLSRGASTLLTFSGCSLSLLRTAAFFS